MENTAEVYEDETASQSQHRRLQHSSCINLHYYNCFTGLF